MTERIAGFGRDTFRSLGIGNFRLFFTGQLISQVGNWMTLLAQTLLVLRLTGDGVAVGILTACQFLPVLVLGAWAGVVADRFDKRRLLLVVQSAAMVQTFALAALAFSGDPPLLAIYALALVGGVTIAFDNPARRSFVVEMVPESHVQNAVSLNSALMTGARVIGPALAGLLVTTVGFGWTFLVDGLSYVAVLVGLWRIDPAKLRSAPVTVRARGQVRAGIRYARSLPELWVPLVMMAIIGSLAFNFQVVVPLFVTRNLSGSESAFTLLFSVLSIGSLAGALATARRTSADLHHVVWSAAAFGAAILLLAASPTLTVAFPVALLVGVSSIAFMTSSTALMQLRADPMMRGRVLALQSLVFLGSTPIGGPLLGAVCEAFGARTGLAVGGLGCLAAAAYGLSAQRRERSARPGDEAPLVATGADLQPV